MALNALVLFPILLACGAGAGVLAGLLGVGGGIVIVPLLYHVFVALHVELSVAMPLAVGTSLSTIILTSFMSVRAHNRRGTIDWALIRRWVPFILLGVGVGMAAASLVSAHALRVLFGVLLVVVSVHMLIAGRRSLAVAPALPGQGTQRVLGTTIGGLSALLGIGGGTLAVPLFSLFSYPIHRAVATAAVFGLVISIPATLGYVLEGWGHADLPTASTGFVNWLGFAALVPATMAFAPLGARLAYRLNVRQLKAAFAVFLLLVGLKMLFA